MTARVCALVTLLGAAACGRGDASRDTTAQQGAATTGDVAWVTELGPTLFIQGDSQLVALELNEQSEAANLSIRLAGPGGAFTPPIAAAVQEVDSAACDAARFALTGRVPTDWTIGVASPDVASIPLDSIEALPPADSSAVAADVARVASMLAPDDTRLRGLPFVALKAYRIRRGDRTTLIATVLRRLPQEATPLEARSFVIGEKVGDGAYALSYGVRSEGSEETVEHFVLLGVLRIGEAEFAVVEREQESGTRYEILQRSTAGEWRIRWSRMLSC